MCKREMSGSKSNKKASLPLALGLGFLLRIVMPFIYGTIRNGQSRMIPRIKIPTPRILVKFYFEANIFLLDRIVALDIGNLFSYIFFIRNIDVTVVIDKGIIGRYNDPDFNLNKKFRVREVF